MFQIILKIYCDFLLSNHARTIGKQQTGFVIIEAFQWRISDQQGTEPSRCRPAYGKYLSTTWLDAVAVIIILLLLLYCGLIFYQVP